MNKFPLWLPKEVRLHSEDLIKKKGLNGLKPLLIRLVTNPEMEKVWAKLSSKTNDPQKLIDFLEYVRLHPTLLGKNTDSILVPSDYLQRTAFNKLSELTQQMINEIAKLCLSKDALLIAETNVLVNPEAKARGLLNIKANRGWTLLEIALKRAELDMAAQASKNASSKATLLNIFDIESRLKEIERHGSIVSILELIGSAADYAATAPDALLPKKRNTENAKRNQLILDLKRYMKLHFGTESATLIAAIVNTAFEPFEDGGVKEDSVRKLKP